MKCRLFGNHRDRNHRLQIWQSRLAFQELRRSWILVFYSSLLSSHKGTPSKFHWLRHLNGSSHLRGPLLWKHGQVCQDSAGEMGILRSICSCCTKDESDPNGWRHEFGSYGIAQVPHDAWFCMLSSRTANFSLRCQWAFWFPTKLWLRNVEKRLSGQRKYATWFQNGVWWMRRCIEGSACRICLSHRTGMPRHDISGVQRKGGVSEMVSHNAVVIYIWSDV